ncbi:sugar ABC transporter substrate-binding protein [Microbacterium suaedae]|uniref:sugar ABC transporter substrate-binding protein n=1 Tax=Microbacterium suaedae TaxID=2067813 RepID=UPI000DA2484B|nr:sugar ABC transporter substrate-binding protein [Microbacterium suaedae]
MRKTFQTRRIAALGIGALALAALTGCSVDTGMGSSSGDGGEKTDGMGGDDTFTVAAFTAGYGTPAGKLSLDDFVEKAEAKGWDVTLYTSAFDYDKLGSDVQAAVAQGADAILAGFPDPRQIAPIVQAANDADIPIFSIDGGVEANDDFVIDVTYDQDAMAQQTIDALEEAMGGLEGKDVMVIGHDPHVGIHTRSNLALGIFEDSGANVVGGEIKQVLDPGTSRTEALNFVTDYLQSNPDGLDGVWAGWDDAALGAVQAIEETGEDDIYVTGVDALAQTTEKIAEGSPMYATASQDWIAVVDELIGTLEDYAASAELPDEPFVALEPHIVDPSNVDDFEPTLGVAE